ncbi:MAG: AAA family ATPase [Cyclobacteriaceae bacterium]
MDKSQLKVTVDNYRAVRKADIDLDGITVITGENGSGKSTISKFIYQSLKISNDFDQYVDSIIENETRKYRRTFDLLGREYLNQKDYIQLKKYLKNTLYSHHLPLFDDNNGFDAVIDFLKSKIKNDIDKEKESYRIKNILALISEDKWTEDFNSIFDKLRDEIGLMYNNALNLKTDRDISVYMRYMNKSFKDFDFDKFSIKEFDADIINTNENKLLPIHSIEKVFYIDSPLLLDVIDSDIKHWKDFHDYIRINFNKFDNDNEVNLILKKNIIKGDVSLNDSNLDEYLYTREDGKIFNLLNCATGLKSFSILQMLGNSGAFDHNTLMIIDEPEAHLHPQWVVEYARLIVLLNKNLGVKFLIASHHPDMISALKYIANEEMAEEGLNYYLAKRYRKTYTYNYKKLGTDIEEIFTSFNVALDRIEQYGKEN